MATAANDARGPPIDAKRTPSRDRSPADALWGAQSQRGIDNYPISGLRPSPRFVRAARQHQEGRGDRQPPRRPPSGRAPPRRS